MVMAEKTPKKSDKISDPNSTKLNIKLATTKSTRDLVIDYQRKVTKNLDYIRTLSDQAKEATLGFYGVAGTANIFSWIPELLERPMAVFDSDSFTWRKQFGGVPCLVQSPEELDTIENVIPVPFRLQNVISKSIEDRKIKNLKVHRLY